MSAEMSAGQHPSLACRPSPPQGGRSDVANAFANLPTLQEERRRRSSQSSPCGRTEGVLSLQRCALKPPITNR
ncbi:hypothetical protein FJ567_20730 [Mesorhizobium sp. B2-4-16]|nr:hypothetical protein FJ567_20730 [Mesorhizobium sp. B2-4-16]